ncbi:MAG: L-seryl-tRNA(Sec) selenium transferase [Anaerohalosphaera sp.]|nr:L-seryl-tRNA(Sec) selenium transferase [Anaerohalosphaera sp.]
MSESMQATLRHIPSVDGVLQRLCNESASGDISSSLLTKITRNVIEQVRQDILAKVQLPADDISDQVIEQVRQQVDSLMKPHSRKVVNAMGIVLHTGLGRAVIAPAAMRQLQEEIAGYSLLQVSITDGKRSARDQKIEQLLTLLTGAEAATVVNNNAAATALVLNTIADGKEVIVSRGQLVEIGGAFRLPDVMAFSGAKLVEVGTTNKTHLHDYANAITENTAAILRVHPSNYKIQGFTSEVPLNEMADLAHANDLVMFDDVGAGSLIDFAKYGFEKEPTLKEAVEGGADVITSSGDKLIGASQAGIILGRADIVKKVRKNQFARIVRTDKMTLAVLEATLRMFLDEEKAMQQVPTVQMLLRPYESIRRQAARLVSKLRKAKLPCQVQSVKGFSQTGSGSLPTQNLPTRLVAIEPSKINSVTLANRLRHFRVPIFTRIQDEQVRIDPRTLMDGDEAIVIDALIEIMEA